MYKFISHYLQEIARISHCPWKYEVFDLIMPTQSEWYENFWNPDVHPYAEHFQSHQDIILSSCLYMYM